MGSEVAEEAASRVRFVYRAECTAGCGLPIGYHFAGNITILHSHNNRSVASVLDQFGFSRDGAEDLFVTERMGLPSVIEDTIGHYRLKRVEKAQKT